MPQITLELPFEEIVNTVKKLSEEEQELLFFAVNKNYAKALGEMRKEAVKEHKTGKSISFEKL